MHDHRRESEAKAKRLREQIEQLKRSDTQEIESPRAEESDAEEGTPDEPVRRKNYRELIHRRMRELGDSPEESK